MLRRPSSATRGSSDEGRTSSSDENSNPSSSTKIRLSWMPSTDCRETMWMPWH